MLDSTVEAIRRSLDEAQEVLVIAHIAPDGDAISSLTAVGLALQQLEKRFTLVCDSGLPRRFAYLSLADRVQTRPEMDAGYDLIIALDAGDADRLGRAIADWPGPLPCLINIDHHITNTMYGQINLVESGAVATAEILFHLLPKLGVELTAPMAECLLTGLVTDTLNFRTAGVSSSTLRIASELVDAGADLFAVTSQALSLKEMSTLQIWQKGLSNMRLDGGLLWTSISNREREATGHNGTSSFGLGNMMANVYQAAISAVLLEMADGRISVGFRCRPPYSVSELAQSLGGGGHHLAAGCTIDGPLERAEALVTEVSKEAIRQQRSAHPDEFRTEHA